MVYFKHIDINYSWNEYMGLLVLKMKGGILKSVQLTKNAVEYQLLSKWDDIL